MTLRRTLVNHSSSNFSELATCPPCNLFQAKNSPSAIIKELFSDPCCSITNATSHLLHLQPRLARSLSSNLNYTLIPLPCHQKFTTVSTRGRWSGAGGRQPVSPPHVMLCCSAYWSQLRDRCRVLLHIAQWVPRRLDMPRARSASQSLRDTRSTRAGCNIWRNWWKSTLLMYPIMYLSCPCVLAAPQLPSIYLCSSAAPAQ